jgi:hypothetical protein
MFRSVTVYLSNGDVENLKQGEDDVINIYLFNNNSVSVDYKDGTETVYTGIPFIYRQ